MSIVLTTLFAMLLNAAPTVEKERISRTLPLEVIQEHKELQSSMIDVDDFGSDRWTILDPKARVVEHLGRKSLHLANGAAFLKDVVFDEGVIEVDIAAPDLVSFVGLIFRVENEGNYELVYFRPHKSGLEDAVQYTPTFDGSGCWQLYSGKGFTSAAVIPKEKWVHVRIEISTRTGKVYFNNSDTPVLTIEDLKRGDTRGSVGIWAFANGGHFSNFSYKKAVSSGQGEKRVLPIAKGTLTQWQLSDAFDASQRDIDTLPSATEMEAMNWQKVGVEPPGMVVIDRYRKNPSVVPEFLDPTERTGKREGRKVVFARTLIHSDRDQIARMSLGYSDEVTVFLNSKPVFTGKSAFRFRHPGFLGIMDIENDAVYLDLKKGRNELVLAVAEYFGGWGFMCRLDDTLVFKL